VNRLFPNTAVIRRVDGEGVLLLGGGRALLLQLAHPSVAAGVADHSDFESHPLRRLWATLEATYTIVFGTRAQAERVAQTIREVHDRVTGPAYTANDPALLCWVHATLVDTALRIYETVFGPLSAADAAAYYMESTQVAELLGCPRDRQPADLAAFHEYVRSMVDTLEVTDTARAVAQAVLNPQLPWMTGPPMALARFLTRGMLPEPIRSQYGFEWTPRDEARVRTAAAAARRLLPLVPRPIRHAPQAWLTRRA
jgi:uncharacterized protein (DUF2236 family)